MNINFFYTNLAMVKSLGLGPAALFGYLTVVTNLPSGTCTASYDTIGEDFGVSRKTVGRWMTKLHNNNYIIREQNEGATYNITIPEDVRVSLEFNIKKPRKKPNVPEEILLVRGLYGRYPKKELWPTIQEKFAGKSSEYVALCHKTWKDQGWNPQNPAWFDWVEKGIPAKFANKGTDNYKVKQAMVEVASADDFIPQDTGGTF